MSAPLHHLAGSLLACGLLAGACSGGRACQPSRVSQQLRAAAQDAGIVLEARSDDSLGVAGSPVGLRIKSVEFTETRAHVHVLATSDGSSLDYCLFGLGADRPSSVDQAATIMARFGLPPLLAATGTNVTGARPFSGRSRWGVPGRRGAAGGTYGRGSLAAEEPPVFVDPPELPSDGRLHLLKAVVECDQDSCARTLELDGQQVQQGHPLRWPLEGGTHGVAVTFAVFGPSDALDDRDAERDARAALARRPGWLFGPAASPCETPTGFVGTLFDDEACLGGRLGDCLEECRAGLAASCYSAALTTQRDNAFGPDVDQAFFLRACALGMASGCTNAAAFRLKQDPADGCAAKAFEAACERGHDPWACTMFARALLDRPQKPALDRLQSILTEACRLGEDDAACRAAHQLIDAP